jgi:small-conductance mechanosensitive channel
MLPLWADFTSQYPWLPYVLQIAALVLGAWLLRRFVIGSLKRWAERTHTDVDDKIVALLGQALTLVLSLAVVAASLNLFPVPDRLLAVINRVLYLCVLAAALYFGAQMLLTLLGAWLARQPGRASLAQPVALLTRVLFAALGVMILADNLGISLTAVWTTLGVGSVAVALALQDTLSNFFAGVYLRLDSPVRVGDYVKLDSGDEGFVTELGWRSTRIRTLPNNTVVVPNSKLASAVITNYNLPDPAMSLLVRVGVSYASDPERVEQILVDEGTKAAGHVPGLLAQPAPFVRFIPGFGDSSLDFTLICRVSTFVDQYAVQHELRKRLFARLRREGVEIPFPQRDLHLRSVPAAMVTPA